MSSSTYLPLPTNVDIQKSSIHGNGIFATKAIPAGYNFGITHVADPEFPDGYIRTPLGGFVNHSTTPNCAFVPHERGFTLHVLKAIQPGEELTADYPLYNPE
jgi:SET domain-containing protein